MFQPSKLRSNQNIIFAVITIIFLVTSCQLKLVSDYDAGVAEAIMEMAKTVDYFYGKILESEESARPYSEYSEDYLNIEIELRALVMRNKIRPLNEESTKISETILEKWTKYRDAHKEKDTYKSVLAKLHRERFTKLFTAMSIAEEAKKLTSSDMND